MIKSPVFPTTREAVDWVMKNHFRVDPKYVSYNMMPGVGTQVVIMEQDNEKRHSGNECVGPD